MRRGRSQPKYVSVREAAAALGVSKGTVLSWVKSGRLKGKTEKPIVVKTVLVLSSSLRSAFNARCVYCNRRFQARRPTRARFCCAAHRSNFYYEKRRRSAGSKTPDREPDPRS